MFSRLGSTLSLRRDNPTSSHHGEYQSSRTERGETTSALSTALSSLTGVTLPYVPHRASHHGRHVVCLPGGVASRPSYVGGAE